jgi:hypothetical protein
VPTTYADIDEMEERTRFRPKISLEKDIERGTEWRMCYGED